MKHRHSPPLVLAALANTLVGFVQGPRQSGKTTLARSLRDHGHSAEYRMQDGDAVPGTARVYWPGGRTAREARMAASTSGRGLPRTSAMPAAMPEAKAAAAEVPLIT